MQNRKLCIALIAALITISLNSCVTALSCATGPPGASNPVTCADGITKCFVKTAGNVVTRGCLTDATCGTVPNCLTCEGTDNCNANVLCKTCLATKATCGTTDGSGAANQLCTTATQQCLNQAQDNGTVTRGCGEPCTDAAKCTGCTTDLCNVGIYPANRRQCYQCDSSAACNTVVNATMLKPCALNQAEGQKCYTIGTSAQAMQRGCSTDTTNNKCAGDTPDPSCAFCDNENGCNNRKYQQVLGKCYKCQNAAACIGAQAGVQALACAPALYNQTANSCFTQRNADGSVQRGCTNERTEPCTADTGCTDCTGDACNANASEFTCYLCRSDTYPDCRIGKSGLSVCQNTANATTANKCFEGEWNGVVLRGCLADAFPLTIYQCLNTADKRCTVCPTANCNLNPFNGASSLQHMGLGMFALIFVVKHYL